MRGFRPIPDPNGPKGGGTGGCSVTTFVIKLFFAMLRYL